MYFIVGPYVYVYVTLSNPVLPLQDLNKRLLYKPWALL